MHYSLFTSEAVSRGHPDKVADQISDAILDACLAQDPDSRVACETLVSKQLVVIAGEITTQACVDYTSIAKKTIREIGYDKLSAGFDDGSCQVIRSLNKQSPDISKGVNPSTNSYHELGAGDQGMMFGYACEETPELMPLPISLANRLIRGLEAVKASGECPYLRPDAKAQVTIQYDGHHNLPRIHTIVLSTQHAEEISHADLVKEMGRFIKSVLPKDLLDDHTLYYINPTGRFVIGGPEGDSGLTGRKIMVDTYGSTGRHGGGAFSGKDPTKVDRSGAYAARYIAKHIVAAKLASKCEIQLAYAIGIPYPISIEVETFGSGIVNSQILREAIPLVFSLSPSGIIQMLDLKRPIYQKTAYGGHFGREDADFSWEKLDRKEQLLEAVDRIITLL